MNIVYSEHAEKRLKQRGILKSEVEDILNFHSSIKNRLDGLKEAVGDSNNRLLKVVFVEEENYIKVITVM